jgi:hypothetical protein
LQRRKKEEIVIGEKRRSKLVKMVFEDTAQ